MENQTEETVEKKKADAEESVDVEAEETPKKETISNEEKFKKEAQEWKDKYFYIAAEMQNSIKRAERERENLLKFGNEKILKNLIEVVDNLDRTLSAISVGEDEKLKSIVDGINMVKKIFLETLEKEGLKRLSSLGQIFDPNFHEALTQMPAEGKKDNEVVQVFEEGYELNGRLLRAAKVVIAKN